MLGLMLSVAHDQCQKDVNKVCSRDSAKSCKVSSKSDVGSCVAKAMKWTAKNDVICYMTKAQFMEPLNLEKNAGYPRLFVDSEKTAYTFQNGCFVSKDKRLCEIKELDAMLPFLLAFLGFCAFLMLGMPPWTMMLSFFPVLCMLLGFAFGHRWNMFASTLRMGTISSHSACVMSRVKVFNGDLWIND
jgi:hypothetical protein